MSSSSRRSKAARRARSLRTQPMGHCSKIRCDHFRLCASPVTKRSRVNPSRLRRSRCSTQRAKKKGSRWIVVSSWSAVPVLVRRRTISGSTFVVGMDTQNCAIRCSRGTRIAIIRPMSSTSCSCGAGLMIIFSGSHFRAIRPCRIAMGMPSTLAIAGSMTCNS